jgi:hypothetical protein
MSGGTPQCDSKHSADLTTFWCSPAPHLRRRRTDPPRKRRRCSRRWSPREKNPRGHGTRFVQQRRRRVLTVTFARFAPTSAKSQSRDDQRVGYAFARPGDRKPLPEVSYVTRVGDIYAASVFTSSNQLFVEGRHFPNRPVRCATCRRRIRVMCVLQSRMALTIRARYFFARGPAHRMFVSRPRLLLEDGAIFGCAGKQAPGRDPRGPVRFRWGRRHSRS